MVFELETQAFTKMADNLQHQVLFKTSFCSPYHEMTEYFYDKQAIAGFQCHAIQNRSK